MSTTASDGDVSPRWLWGVQEEVDEESGGPENQFHRGANGSKVQDLGGKQMTFEATNGSTQ